MEGTSGFIFRMKPCEACHEPPTTPLKPLHTEYTLSFFSPCCCPLYETLEPPMFSQPNSRQETRLRLTGLLYSLLANQKYHKVRPQKNILGKHFFRVKIFKIERFNQTRNYGPSGLRCSLRLQGDIIDIMYRFWPPKFEQRENQKHDIKQKGPKIFPLKTIIIY